MRFIFIILFLTTIVANELVVDILLYKDYEISIFDSPVESQSEKENQDTTEKENKIDYFNEFDFNTLLNSSKYNLSPNCISAHMLVPYLEIQSPPPELFKFSLS